MKRLFKVLTCLLSVFLMAAAASGADEAVEIGLAWVGKAEMAKTVTEGFEEGIREAGPTIKVEYQKELASYNDLAKVVERWQQTKKAMVILRSEGAEWLAANPPAIPAFIGGCNHPGQLGVIKNLNAPEGNITGVTYYIPVELKFEIFKAILPNMTSVMLLLEEGHPSTPIEQEETKAACSKMGIQYNEKSCLSVDDAVSSMKQFEGKVSAVLLSNSNLTNTNAEVIVKAGGNMPILSYASRPVEMGGLGGFIANDRKLGRMLAESVVEVVIKGKAVKDVPVKTDPDPSFIINIKTAEKLGIKIPYHILKKAKIIE